jgi:hypothetical protein
MSQSLILIDTLSSICWKNKEKEKKKKERETSRDTLPRAGGQTCLAGCAGQDFHGC